MDVLPSINRGTQLFSVWIVGLCWCIAPSAFAQQQNGTDIFLVTISVAQSPDCFDSANGQLLATPANGVPPYTYVWNDPLSQTTPIATGLAAGNYACTVFDQTGDFGVDNFLFEAPDPLQLLFNETPTCAGEANGNIDILVNGGTPPFSYQWNNGAGTVEDPSGLIAGNYLLTVQDANGCETQGGILVPEYPNPLNVLVESTDISCFGICDGTAEAIVNGGTGNYTYLWDNGATGSFQTGLCPGVHGVSVNDDNGCSFLFNFFTGFSPGFIVSSTEVDLQCGGFDNGAIDLSVALANPPYTYLWSTGATTEDVSNLPEGNYTVTITDVAGCETMYSTSVDAPPSINVSSTISDPTCPGNSEGAIDLTVSGGVPPFTYLWSHGLGTSEDQTGLSAGNYSVSITDNNGCTLSETFSISTTALLDFDTQVTDVNCDGSILGSIAITASGGQLPYTYLWNNGATSASLTGLIAGWYDLSLSDANGCLLSTSVEVSAPDLTLSSLSSVVEPACEGDLTGAIQATVSGGVLPLTYEWSVAGAPNASSLGGLAAGQYFLTVTDASGCSQMDNVTITEPTVLVADVQNIQSLLCFGLQDGTADAMVSGGTPPYSYLWASGATNATANDLFGGNQNVLVLDANGCDQLINFFVFEPPALIADATVTDDISCNGNADGAISLTASGGTPSYSFSWSNGGTVQNPVGLTAGDYSVTVEDQAGCKAFDAAQVQEPLPLIGSVGLIEGVSCNGESDGFAVANASGGIPFYTFLWDNGTTTNQSTNLTAGIHSVSIIDINSCSVVQTVNVTEPPVLELQVQSQAITCEGGDQGALQAIVGGGTLPYTYQWSNGETTAQIDNLAAGNYSLTLIDGNACSQIQSLELTDPTGLEVDILTTPTSCSYLTDGTATLNASGGLAPYTWIWQNGATTSTVTGLVAGSYTSTVLDANGCSSIESFGIGSPNALKVKDQSIEPVLCFGAATGSLEVMIEGGTLPYTFNWSSGDLSNQLNELPAGIYELTVQDANSCVFGPVEFTVEQPDTPVSASVEALEPTCSYRSDGALDLTVEGGTPGYIIEWSTGETGLELTDLAIGEYQVSITDGNDCLSEWTYSLPGPDPITVTLEIKDPNCSGDSNGSIQVDTSNLIGGTLPFIYQLGQSFQTTNRFDGLAAGAYALTVQDIQGCEAVFPINLIDPPVLVLDLGADQNIQLGQTVELRPQVNSGSPLEYNWQPLEFLGCANCETVELRPLNDIEYTLEVADT
ncbi:MAG: SprB repeat-containing protein, partial [Bacteroidota bacterium]